jgi:hypothetical protein
LIQVFYAAFSGIGLFIVLYTCCGPFYRRVNGTARKSIQSERRARYMYMLETELELPHLGSFRECFGGQSPYDPIDYAHDIYAKGPSPKVPPKPLDAAYSANPHYWDHYWDEQFSRWIITGPLIIGKKHTRSR